MNQELLKTLFEYKDGKLFWKVRQGNCLPGTRAGFDTDTGYRRVGVLGKEYKEHRVIFLLLNGHLPAYVDHINGIRDDNRIENLRECSSSDNGCNRRVNKNTFSGYKNVYYLKTNHKWYVRIQYKGVDRVFGYFDDLEFACLVAEEARDKYHGKFARHD